MDRLQPDRFREPNPDASDEGYDRARQREIDDEMTRAELRKQAEDRAIASAMKLLGLQGEVADSALRTLYRFGVMDGALRVAAV